MTMSFRKGVKTKITEEVFQVGGGPLSSPEDAAVYLMCFNGHAALVDAGCGGSTDAILRNIRACGVEPEQVELLLITHCHFDHTGGAEALKERLRLRVAAHAEEVQYLERGDNRVTAADWYGGRLKPFGVDIRLTSPRDQILLGGRTIEAIHTPGHSPGSVVFLTESEGLKTLFGQDVHGPLHPSLLSNKKDYLRSLELLLSLEADILCEGHYGVFKGKKEVAGFIRQFLEE